MEGRVYNLSAGPAVLPDPVLTRVRDNLLNYQGTGLGIMELSHRCAIFTEIVERAEANLREILSIGEDYSVLFLPSGATLQFSMVPMNLLSAGQTADYVVTGSWAKKAYQEAKKFGSVNLAASSEEQGFRSVPREFSCSPNSAYFHYTSNNTIYGTQFHSEPEVEGVLVCDASSDLLYKKIDVSKYGLIYASAQKNLGPAGVTIVIIRKDLLKRSPADLPVMLDYNTHEAKRSVYNTPPTFPIYVVGEVFEWIKNSGGLEAIEEHNRKKAAILYEFIDACDLYQGIAEKDCRSLMNVTFRTKDKDLDQTFTREATEAGFALLGGHRSAGGMRASLYNAFPREGVEKLVSFMKDFAQKHGS